MYSQFFIKFCLFFAIFFTSSLYCSGEKESSTRRATYHNLIKELGASIVSNKETNRINNTDKGKQIEKGDIETDSERKKFETKLIARNMLTTKNDKTQNITMLSVVTETANKIVLAAKDFLTYTQSLEEKNEIFTRILTRIKEAAHKRTVRDNHNEIKKYLDIIVKSFDLIINKLYNPIDDEGETEMKKVFIDKIERYSYNRFLMDILNNTSIDPKCDEKIQSICAAVRGLHKITCGNQDEVTLEQLCDGILDCTTELDETNCTGQVGEKIRQIINLMNMIDTSMHRKCLLPNADGKMYTYDHKILRDIVEMQWDFYQHYLSPKAPSKSLRLDSKSFALVSVKANEVSTVMSSLLYALEDNLCTSVIESGHEEKVFIEDDIFKRKDIYQHPTNWKSDTCVCKHQFCKTSQCEPRCKALCWQRYSLNHWACLSNTGGTSVSLDLICDGKTDCSDKTDEESCTKNATMTEYKANLFYLDTQKMLSLKIFSRIFRYSQNKMVEGIRLIRELQELISEPKVTIQRVKKVRDQFYQKLVEIFEDVVNTSSSKDVDDAHSFLFDVSETMVLALKNSCTGNKNVTSTRCACRKNQCANKDCPPSCVPYCYVEPIFTRYICKTSNKSIPIKSVCNVNIECPDKDDEKGCKKEACQHRHFSAFREALQKLEIKMNDTIAKQELDEWKTKVIGTLKLAEGKKKPTRWTLEDTVSRALRDLASVYASMETANDTLMDAFQNMSHIIKRSLKICVKAKYVL